MIDEMNKAEAYTTRLLDMAIAYAPKVVAAILVFWIGSVVIKLVAKMLGKLLDARGVELTLRRFLNSLVTIGLALQGTLANFAGGTLILFFKPYKVGDLIEAQGITGVVKEIQIFTTVLLTPENKTAIIPNGPMANGNIINHTREGSVRVDLTFGLDSTAPIGAAREVLMEVMRQHPNVLKEPAPSVNIAKLTLDGVELAVRPYCAPGDYWTVYFETYEQGLAALQKAHIGGPQHTVRVMQVPSA